MLPIALLDTPAVAPKQRASLLMILSAVLPLLLAGCQSNAQHDLVARELRMQEDQMYAMENYLEQYQQLVCKYRSENATLRRRLADDYYDETGELPEPRLTPPSPARQRPMPSSPSEAPSSPGPEDVQPEMPEVEVPDVPPLEGSTQDESRGSEVETASYEELTRHEEPTAEAADHAASEISELYEIEAAVATINAELPVEPPEAAPSGNESFSPVWLHGEVVENDTGGGPRMTVNIDHFDRLGNHLAFEGTLSLMLMAATADRSQTSLARWDFNADDVNAAIVDAAFEPTMRFHLELPADTPLDETTELWVRLVPAEGAKLLAHTPIDLQQPGSFSSRSESPTSHDQESGASIAASNEEAPPVDEAHDPAMTDDAETPGIGSRIAVNIVGSDWTIARPNEPANLPAEPEPGGGWRTSSEIIPTVVQSIPAAPRQPQDDVQPAAHAEIAAAPPHAPAYKPPTWSPERTPRTGPGERQTPPVARRPAWSATR